MAFACNKEIQYQFRIWGICSKNHAMSVPCVLTGIWCAHSGLEDQLLALVVAEERPDLEEAKNQLIVSNAKMKQELKEIEDEILFRLSSTEGNPVDNEELIQVLGASKIKAAEIQVGYIIINIIAGNSRTLTCELFLINFLLNPP